MAERETGTVKWFNKSKGYGFIQPKQGKDLFVHQNSIRDNRPLHDGDKVEFTPAQGDKGLQADDVVVLD